MNKTKKIILGFLILLIFCVGWFYYHWHQEDFMPSKERKVIVNLGSGDKPVFLRAKVWGVSGNHEEIVLSESNKLVSDKATDYIFYTSDVYYKIDKDGSIILYAPKSSISEPLKKFSNVSVKIERLKSADEVQDYNANYKKYGLKKISVYDK